MSHDDDQPSPPRRKKRAREYTLFSIGRFAYQLSNQSRDHNRPGSLHQWIFTVYARSIRQAYYLAGEEKWAVGRGKVGIRRVELGRRFRQMSKEEAREEGLIIDAPYFRPRDE